MKEKILQCILCEKEFINKSYYKRKTCSKKCFIEYNRQYNKGRSYDEMFGERKHKIIKKKINKRKGYKHSILTKEKIGIKNKGKKRTKEQREHLSKIQKGKKRGSFEEQFGIKKANEIKKKISQSSKKIKRGPISEYHRRMLQLKAGLKKKGKTWEEIYGNEEAMRRRINLKKRKLKTYIFDNKKFRSNWEVAFARYCVNNNIKYNYEERIFNLGNKLFYTPDFYLPKFDLWIEVKGWWDKNSKKKIKLFMKNITPRIALIDKTNIGNFLNGYMKEPFNELGFYNFPFSEVLQ